MMLKGTSALACALTLAIGLTHVTSAAARERDGKTASPYLITVGDPADPALANAGPNLRNGVGSLFIEFDGIPVGGYICTASVIGPRHVLTAAHCVRETGDTVRRIRLVLSAGRPAPLVLEASGFAVHPWYDLFQPFYGAFAHGDVAVVELAQPVPEDTEVYALYTARDEFQKGARHYGHGASGTGNKGATGPSSFYYARTGLNTYEQVLEPLLGDGIDDQLLFDFDSGGRKHNAMEWWFTSLFRCAPENPDNPPQAQDGQCTTFKDGSYPDFKGWGKLEVGLAPGDSGGPGFIDGKIAGVHSFGFTHLCAGVTNGTDFTCGLDSSYGEMSGDTRVSSHATWIAGVTAGTMSVTPVPEELAAAGSSAEAPPFAQNARARFFVENVLSRTLRQAVSTAR